MPNPLTKLLPRRFRKSVPEIPVVRMSGPIMSGGNQLRPSLSIATASPMLRKAFAHKKAPAVAIIVNSPGGSPVQARLIYQRIRDLADEKNKAVLVFVEDAAASGGYMIACAGDEIIADPSSIVGSIGVVSAGFGFVEAIDKLGIERRVHTSGNNKAVLDPFRAEREEDVEHLKALQSEVHQTFIDLVKARRGQRLQDHEDMFTGMFWSGERGQSLGLVDALGDVHGTLVKRYGADVRPRLVQPARDFLNRKQPGVSAGSAFADATALAGIGAGAADQFATMLEERALWARYGL